MLKIRTYEPGDWLAIQKAHDVARQQELALVSLPQAFLPLSIAAEREDLFEYPGLYVAELDGIVAGFAACTEEELAWLYVAPEYQHRGIATVLIKHCMEQFPGIEAIEVLYGNEPARHLYEKMGFTIEKTLSGQMPGNEDYFVTVYSMRKK